MLSLDPRAEALLAPVQEVLQQALGGLRALDASLRVEVAELPGTHRVELGRVLLDERLLQGVSHPCEASSPLPPLDRWRRAAGAVLEGVATQGLAACWGQTPADTWPWVGVAVHLADRAAPVLGLADPDLAVAIESGAPGVHPRVGVAVARGWEAMGRDPVDEAGRIVAGGLMDPDDWVEIGEWVLGARGARGALSVQVALPTEVDIPLTLPPWSWARLRVPAHPRGGVVKVDGPGAVAEPWAAGGVELRTLAGATHERCGLEPHSGGPLGTWDVASAEGYGQVMGARGISYRFHGDGRLEIVMADAFVGPLAMLEMAETVGTSGLCRARWSVSGNQQMRFHDIDTSGLTMHGRQQEYMMPAQGMGMNQWLGALDEHPWRWAMQGERLELRGTLMGGSVQVWLDPA